MIKTGSLFRGQIVKQLKKDISGSGSLFVLQYEKLSSPQMTSLRASLRRCKSKLLVTKNSLMKRAFSECQIAGLDSFLEGPAALVIGHDDISAISKALFQFAKENQALILRGAFFKGSLLQQKDIDFIAKLPSREALITRIVMAIKYPLAELVFTLKGPLNKLAIVLNQIKEKKQEKV